MSSECLRKSLNLFFLKELLRTSNSELPTNRCSLRTPNTLPSAAEILRRTGELRTCGLGRRDFLRWLLGFSLLPTLTFSAQRADAQGVSPASPERRSIAEFFKGEELEYEVGAWIFKRVALGKLSFKEMGEKGRYLSTLQGETLGILGWVARYRVDTYRSIMEEVEGGRRLRSISFEEDVKVGSKLRRRTHFFDYQKRKWVRVRQRKDGTKVREEEGIPPGMVYDDFLTASYNFRYGVYGGIERGQKYTVATFPKKGPSSYEVSVASKEEEEKRKKSEKFKEGKEYFVKLFLDPEVTHSKEGLIEGWLSKELSPTEGTIKDVMLFGDVKGKLIKNSRG